MESLQDKLKSLGVQVGAGKIAPPENRRRESVPIHKVVEGEEFFTPFGTSFAVQKAYRSHYCHGDVVLETSVDMDMLAEWGKVNRLSQTNIEKVLFLDTETSGLSGGTGTFVFMVGMGYFKDGEFKLIQTFLRSPDEEAAFLVLLTRFSESFEAVVTYNGKAFDLPMLRTRHLLNTLPFPFENTMHIDLLHLARRLWRNRLPSRRLGEIETSILNFHRTGEEIPGWLVPELYYEYLKTGNAQKLKGVFYHNEQDILSLAALFLFVSRLLEAPLDFPGAQSLDLIAIARLYAELERLDEATRIYEESLQQGLPRAFFLQTLQRFALLHRKKGNWNAAVQLWRQAFEEKQVDACVELAKYYEHQQRDYLQALFYAEQAIKLFQGNPIEKIPNVHTEKSLRERLNRLQKKIQK